jgi:hypothetical protein
MRLEVLTVTVGPIGFGTDETTVPSVTTSSFGSAPIVFGIISGS